MPSSNTSQPTRLMEVEVVGTRQLTPRIREYVFTRPDGVALPSFDAGSHIELHFQAGKEPLIRRYSLVAGVETGVEAQRVYRIAVQREAHQRGSDYIHAHFQIGTRLNVSHPKNDFPLDRRDARTLLIAGGIGITPIFSMAHSLAQRHREFEMVYAGRSASEMAYLAEVQASFGERARIHTDDSPSGRIDLLQLLASQPEGSAVYVCGPLPMVRATKAAAAQLGWPDSRIRSELFGPPPLQSPGSFEVELRRSGRTLQVGPYTSILEAMMADGMRPLFDCGRGECGLCALPVVAADGQVQHRDIFLTEEQKARSQSLCICVSRLQGTRLTLDA